MGENAKVALAHLDYKGGIIMAKVDMNEIKKTTNNSAEVDELKVDEPVEAGTQSEELIDNALETSEDTNEIKEEDGAEADKTGSGVIVRYVGGGIWKDSKGALWASEKKSENILNERQYTVVEYEERSDIKFMVQYGAMKETYVK